MPKPAASMIPAGRISTTTKPGLPQPWKRVRSMLQSLTTGAWLSAVKSALRHHESRLA